MSNCPQCSHFNPPGVETCTRCGQPLTSDPAAVRQAVLHGAAEERELRLRVPLEWALGALLLLNGLLFVWNYVSDADVSVDHANLPAVALPDADLAALPVPEFSPPETRVEVPLPELQGARVKRLLYRTDADLRKHLDALRGHNDKAQRLIDKGLAYLARHLSNGVVDIKPDRRASSQTAVTALALQALLANGHAPGTDARHAATADRTLQWLLANQQDDGQFGPTLEQGNLYVMTQHGIAAQAVVEAFAMTAREDLHESAQRAVQYIIDNQLGNGCWTYRPRAHARIDARGETTVMGWQIMTLAQAKKSGLRVPARVFRRADEWIRRYSHPSGRVGDTAMPDPSDQTIVEPTGPTSVALMCRLAMGQRPTSPANAKAIALMTTSSWLPHWPTSWRTPGDARLLHLFYFYHGSTALAQVGGKPWVRWREALHTALLPNARESGTSAYWPHIGRFNEWGDEPYATALAVLALSAPHRYVTLD